MFAGLDIQIPRGKITAVMGPSGTGKTTLLRLITGQVLADTGAIEVAGANMRTLSRTNLYVLRRKMGMLFQNGALLTDLSVFENVAFPLREHTDLTERLIRQLVLTKLQAVGLRGAAELMPAELSGGMSRRVALARAIVMDPEADQILLLSGGKVVANGTPQELKTNPTEIVKQFIGGLADGPVPFHFPAPDYFDELLSRKEAL